MPNAFSNDNELTNASTHISPRCAKLPHPGITKTCPFMGVSFRSATGVTRMAARLERERAVARPRTQAAGKGGRVARLSSSGEEPEPAAHLTWVCLAGEFPVACCIWRLLPVVADGGQTCCPYALPIGATSGPLPR